MRTQPHFIREGTNVALMVSNVSLALDLIGSAETAAAGRESAVPEAARFTKLRAFRIAHLSGAENAWPIVLASLERFRTCHPVFLLEVLAAKAWLEKQSACSYSDCTLSELALFEILQLNTLKAALTAQGFPLNGRGEIND